MRWAEWYDLWAHFCKILNLFYLFDFIGYAKWGLSKNGYSMPGKHPLSGGSIFIPWWGLIFDRNHQILNYQIKTKPVSSRMENKKNRSIQVAKNLMRDFSLSLKIQKLILWGILLTHNGGTVAVMHSFPCWTADWNSARDIYKIKNLSIRFKPCLNLNVDLESVLTDAVLEKSKKKRLTVKPSGVE